MVTLDNGLEARPAFELLARRCREGRYIPDEAARQTDIAAGTIRRVARELGAAGGVEQSG